MRQNAFIKGIQESFPVQDNKELARDIANAMQSVIDSGMKNTGRFSYGNNDYIIRATWVDHCIAGNCNPATCYTDWSLDTDEIMKAG